MKSECADTEINSVQSSNKWIHSKRVHSNDTGAMDMKKAKFQYEAAEWLDMKVQDATLEQWRHSPEIWDELLSIGRLLHQLGVFVPCTLHN